MLREFTSIEQPFYLFDVARNEIRQSMEGSVRCAALRAPVSHGSLCAPRARSDGVLYHAVDHLPSECPREATAHFGDCLARHIPAIARSDCTRPWAAQTDLPEEIRGAVITAGGKLTPRACARATRWLACGRPFSSHMRRGVRRGTEFEYIKQLRELNERNAAKTASTPVEATSTLNMFGHVFDKNVMNRCVATVYVSIKYHIAASHTRLCLARNLTQGLNEMCGRNRACSTVDIVEEFAGSLEIIECQVGADKGTKTRVTLKARRRCAHAMGNMHERCL